MVDRRTVSLTPEDRLIGALEFFGDRQFDEIPIVEAGSRDRLLGYVAFSAILHFNQREHAAPEVARPTIRR